MKAGETSMTARRVAAYRLSFPRQPATYGNPAADDCLQMDVARGVKAGSGSATYLARYLAGWTVLKATDPAGAPLRPGGGNSAFVVAAVVAAA